MLGKNRPVRNKFFSFLFFTNIAILALISPINAMAVDSISPVITPEMSNAEWDHQSDTVENDSGRAFEFKDDKLIHNLALKNGTGSKDYKVTYTKVGSLSYSDFWDPKNYIELILAPNGDPNTKGNTMLISKDMYNNFTMAADKSYEVYKMPATGHTQQYLVVERASGNSVGKTVGLFTYYMGSDSSKNQFRTNDWKLKPGKTNPSGSFNFIPEDPNGVAKEINWHPYIKSGTSYSPQAGTDINSWILVKKSDGLHAFDPRVEVRDYLRYGQGYDSTIWKYIQLMNEQGPYNIGVGSAKGTICPLPPGSKYTAEEYKNCFFQDAGNIEISGDNFKSDEGTVPTIKIPASPSSSASKRPVITFVFRRFVAAKGVYNVADAQLTNNYFYFISTNPDYPNLGIRFMNCENNGTFMALGEQLLTTDTSLLNKDDAQSINDGLNVSVNQDQWYKDFIKKIYNTQTPSTKVTSFKDSADITAGECPSSGFLNMSDGGWIDHWKSVDSKLVGGIDKGLGNQTDEGICGKIAGGFIQKIFTQILCAMVVALNDFAYGLMSYAENLLMEVTSSDKNDPVKINNFDEIYSSSKSSPAPSP